MYMQKISAVTQGCPPPLGACIYFVFCASFINFTFTCYVTIKHIAPTSGSGHFFDLHQFYIIITIHDRNSISCFSKLYTYFQ